MLFRLANNKDPDSFASRLRRRRMDGFAKLLELFDEPVRVLDVGGTVRFWRTHKPSMPKRLDITLLNLYTRDPSELEGVRAVTGDARRMVQFADSDFDVCFSNSVIEHLGNLEDQRLMAAEIRRVATSYWVQTPNLYFPVEPHFLVPGWQFMPVALRSWLHRRIRLGWMHPQPDRALARADVEQIRLLDAREYRGLFPDGEIRRERVGPLTKSLIAVRPAT